MDRPNKRLCKLGIDCKDLNEKSKLLDCVNMYWQNLDHCNVLCLRFCSVRNYFIDISFTELHFSTKLRTPSETSPIRVYDITIINGM